MTKNNVELYDDPNRYAEPGRVEINGNIKFYGYQKFNLSDTYVEINPMDAGLVKKKQLTKKIFYSDWIKAKSMMDIGSNSAYFCYHGLFKGANHATAVEMDSTYVDMIRTAKNHIGIKDLTIEDKNVMDIEKSADLVLAFALIHWIYSCTSDYGSLDLSIKKLASLTNQMLVIEWIEPEDEAIKFFKHTEWNQDIISEAYTRENFENALSKYFKKWEYVGDIKSTRKLYFAYKEESVKNEIESTYTGLPLQDVFIELNENGVKYSILRNKEIILDGIDKFNDLTIDLLIEESSVDLLSKLLGKSNYNKSNNFDIYQFELGEYENQKIHINLRLIKSNDNYFSRETFNLFINHIDKTNGVNHLSTEYEVLYLIYCSLYNIGAMDNNYNEVIRELSTNTEIKITSKNINNFSYLYDILNRYGISKNNSNQHLNGISFDYLNPLQTVLQSRILCWYNGVFYSSRIYKYLENENLIIQKQANKDIIINEYTLLSNLNSNYFPKVFDLKEEENYSSFKMEFIDGKNLQEIKSLKNLLSNNEIKIFIDELLNIIEILKSHNIVHRDISPSNIILRNKKPVLIDFGWAESDKIKSIDAPGLGGNFRPKDNSFSDVYSVGKVLSIILNGIEEYEELISKMTDENSNSRIEDINQLKLILENIKIANPIDKAINLVEKGKKLLEENNVTNAYEYFISAKSIISNKEAAEIGIFYLLAFCEYHIGEYDKASENITTEMILNPDNESAFDLDEKINEKLEENQLDNIENNKEWSYDISIIIPVYNKHGITEQCIRSIYDNTSIPFELIVVDNGSDEETKNALWDLSNELEFKLIRNNENLGFSVANNQGIEIRKGKHIFLLNNDTIVTSNWIESSLDLLKSKSASIVGSCLLYPESDIIQHKGVRIGTEDGNTLAPYHPYQYYKLNEVENKTEKVSAVTGAAMLISSDLIDAISGLDEGYINGLEDIDYCFKATSVGAEIWYNSESIIYHYESISQDRHKYDIQNWQRLNQKWLGKINFDETQDETIQNVQNINKKKNNLNSEIVNESTDYINKVLKNDISEEVNFPFENIDFSFIIPVHNNLSYTKKCIDNIYKTSALYSIEVIVINNNSTDETFAYLKSLGDLVKVINNEENKSYSYANNQGAKIARGKYLIFLNNDVEIQAGSLESLEETFKSDENIGVQGAKLIYPNGLIQHAGVIWGPVSESMNLHYHIYLAANPNVDWVNKKREFQMITGAFLSIRTEVFDKIGHFDENYYFGHEDLDLCLSTKEVGYKVIYNPDVVGIHHESITKKSEGIQKFERFITEPNSFDAKNHKYFLSKWESKIEIDAQKYYLEDGIYGLAGDPQKFDLFQIKLKELFAELKSVKEDLYQRKAKKVSEILFDNPSYDFVKNVNLLLNTSYERLLKAVEFVKHGTFEDENRKLKILMTMYGWNDSGGGTIFPRDVAIQYVKEGYEVLVIYAGVDDCDSNEKYLIKEWEDEGVKLCGIYNREIKFIDQYKTDFEINDPDVSRIFENKLKEFNPDVVHFNNFVGLSFNIAKIAKSLNYKTLYTPFNYHLIDPKLYMINSDLNKWDNIDLIENSEELKTDPSLKDGYLNRIEAGKQVLNNHIDMTLAVSKRVKDILIEFGCKEEKITIINQVPKSANELEFDNDPEKIHNPISIGFIGGAMPHKGVHNLVLACSVLPMGSAELNIYGFIDPNYKKVIEGINLDIPLNIKGEYKFKDLNNIAKSIDLAVLPSIWEDCAPFAILESLSMGLPVIAPNIGGFSDFIENDFNGKIFTYDNVEELARIIHELVSEPQKIIELRKNSKLSFGFKDYINHLKHVYSRTVENTLLPLEIEYLFKSKLNIKHKKTDNSQKSNSNSHSENSLNEPMNRSRQDNSIIGGFSNKDAIGELPNPLPNPLKINLGCGRDIKKDYVNIDLFSDDPSVVKMDIRNLNIENNSVDYILASDVLEHFSHRETQKVLKEWNRVLKEGAEIEIRCPNLKLQLQAYMRGDWDADIASYMIFGGQTNPGDYHCIGFDKESIFRHLINAGFEITSYEEHDFPQNKGFINLNMTVKAKKIVKDKSHKENNANVYKLNNQISKTENNQESLKNSNYNPQLNIVWEGSQFIYHSLALVNREMSYNIINSGQANLTIVPYEENTFSPEGNPKFEILNNHHVDNKIEDGISEDKPYVWIRHQWPPKNEVTDGAKWIIMQPWEFSSLRKDVYDVLKNADEIWTPSLFSRDAMINSGLDFNKVQVIPNGINPHIFKPFGPKYNLNTNAKIKFLFVGGTLQRKGIDILLKTIVKTFTKNDPIALIIKDIGGSTFYQGQTAQEQINTLQQNPNTPELIYIDKDLSEEEMASLYRACDVFISPYRGEGFCLPALEAMASGLPVVVTDGGATDDFVDDLSGWKITSTQKKLEKRGIEYVNDPYFLDPDEDDLQNILNEIYKNPNFIKHHGIIASYRARKNWTWENATLKMFMRLDYLYDTSMAIEYKKQIIDVDDDYVKYGEAEYLLNNQEYEKAISLLNEIKDNELVDKATLTKALVAVQNNNNELCLDLINDLDQNKYHVDISYLKTLIYLSEEKYIEALETINPIVENWIENKWKTNFALSLDILIQLIGDTIYTLEDFDSAEKIYDSAIENDDMNLSAYLGKAKSMFNLGKAKESVELLESIKEKFENEEVIDELIDEINSLINEE